MSKVKAVHRYWIVGHPNWGFQFSPTQYKSVASAKRRALQLDRGSDPGYRGYRVYEITRREVKN